MDIVGDEVGLGSLRSMGDGKSSASKDIVEGRVVKSELVTNGSTKHKDKSINTSANKGASTMNSDWSSLHSLKDIVVGGVSEASKTMVVQDEQGQIGVIKRMDQKDFLDLKPEEQDRKVIEAVSETKHDKSEGERRLKAVAQAVREKEAKVKEEQELREQARQVGFREGVKTASVLYDPRQAGQTEKIMEQVVSAQRASRSAVAGLLKPSVNSARDSVLNHVDGYMGGQGIIGPAEGKLSEAWRKQQGVGRIPTEAQLKEWNDYANEVQHTIGTLHAARAYESSLKTDRVSYPFLPSTVTRTKESAAIAQNGFREGYDSLRLVSQGNVDRSWYYPDKD